MYGSGHNVPMMPGMAGPPMMGYPGYQAMLPCPGSYGSMVRPPLPVPLPLLRYLSASTGLPQVAG